MTALDQIVVVGEILFRGDGLVVAQEVEQVLVAVEQVICAIEVDLGRAMAVRHPAADLQTCSLPEVGNGVRFVPTEGVAIGVEHFDRIFDLVVGSGAMVAMVPGEFPDRARFFCLFHVRAENPCEDLRG